MSKWLRRGFGNSTLNTNGNTISNHNLNEERQTTTTTNNTHPTNPTTATPTSEFPSPPRNEMPSASAAVYHQHHQQQHFMQQQQQQQFQHHHQPPSSSMMANAANSAGFESTPMAMELDGAPPSSRASYPHKFSQPQVHPSYHPSPPGTTSTPTKQNYDARKVIEPRVALASSNNNNSNSTRDRRSSSRPSSSPSSTNVYPSSRGGGMGATSAPISPPVPSQQQQQQRLLGGHFGNTTPPPGVHLHHHTSSPVMATQQQPQLQQQHPPMTSYAKDALAQSGTPPDSIQQPSYPPPAVTADSPEPSEVSQRRPAYLLHRDLVIGKGSYGQVCIASRGEPEGHNMSGNGRTSSGKRKKFACKCVLLRSDPKYIAKLQEEVNVLRELRGHQNVIRLFDVFCVDNELFIITELGRGGDLFHLLTTHPKHGVTEAYAAKTVSEMLSSVAFLHSRSICHRDLKLENWVLESGKDVWSPLKLIDFGLSTHFSPGQRLSRVVGSSYYVAPEVLKKSYTEACDLWSLGVIVYMLLSGAPPFYGKNDEAIKASIVQGEYTFPHELFRDVSDEAMAFVSTLLSYNIEYRYTAEQALTHPWLATNCDPEGLQRAKDGARGIGLQQDTTSTSNRMDAM